MHRSVRLIPELIIHTRFFSFPVGSRLGALQRSKRVTVNVDHEALTPFTPLYTHMKSNQALSRLS